MKKDDIFLGLEGACQDITERKRAEIAERESLRRLELIASRIPGFVYQFRMRADGSSCFPYASHGIRDLFRLEPEQVHEDAQAVFAAIHPDDLESTNASIKESAINLTLWQHEFRLMFEDGTVKWLSGKAYPERESDGSILWHGVDQDITERRKADEVRKSLEAQLRESQKMQAIGTLAGGIAHDFNNILTVILGNAEVLRQLSVTSPEMLVPLEGIEKASDRACDLVRQILSFSRRQPTELKPIKLQPIIAESVSLLRATLPARIELIVQNNEDIPAVLADATQIEQVLLNLSTNSMQAIGELNGRIEIRLEAVTVEPTFAAAHPALCRLIGKMPRKVVRISVVDNGTGMDSATVNRIFEPFFTTKPMGEGTGLGLSILHGIVESHSGATVVESQMGIGTTFMIYLPMIEQVIAPENEVGTPLVPLRACGQQQKILYLDDDELVRQSFSSLVKMGGYQVLSFSDQAEALAAIRSDPNSFAAVVSDYNMPGMSGLEFATKVREISHSLPVALTSGFIDELLSGGAKAAGVRSLIPKPCDYKELFAILRSLTAPS